MVARDLDSVSMDRPSDDVFLVRGSGVVAAAFGRPPARLSTLGLCHQGGRIVIEPGSELEQGRW